MRPRYLELEGLQSFKEVQKIDFDKLSETGLFGIFGPTGSGKSTVLDAITLALYGEVNRALSGTQGIINTAMKTVKVSFVFDLKKENGSRTYKVERVYGRKKGSENSCEAKLARLVELNAEGDIPLADKPREVTSRVEELLGLKHDDFTRAVVLPQNKFQEFLMMEKSRKREMLERIFYLEEYGKQLNDKVSRKISILKAEIAGVNGALSTLGDASDEALKLSEKNLEEAEKTREKAVKVFAGVDKIYLEAKDAWQLTNELEVILKREKELLAGLDEIGQKRSMLDNAIKAEGIIDLIKDYKNFTQDLSEIMKKLEELDNELPQLSKKLEKKKAEFDTFKIQSEVEKPKLLERKTRLIDALELKKDIEKCKNDIDNMRLQFKSIKEQINEKALGINKRNDLIYKDEDSIAKLKEAISNMRVDIQYREDIRFAAKLEDEIANISKDIGKQKEQKAILTEKTGFLQKKLDDITEKSNKYKLELEELNSEKSKLEEAKPGNRDEISSEREYVNDAKLLYSTLKVKNEEINKLSARIYDMSENMKILQADLNNQLKLKIDLETVKNDHIGEVENLRKLVSSNSAYILAESLKEGEACPVCGSIHHPARADGGSKEDISKLEQNLAFAESKVSEADALLRTAENKCIILSEKIRGVEDQIKLLNQDLKKMYDEFNGIIEKLPEQLRSYKFDKLENIINDMQLKLEKRILEADKWDEASEGIRIKLEGLSNQLSALLVDNRGVETELQVNLGNLRQIEIVIDDLQNEHITKNKTREAYTAKYSIQDASVEFKRISENDMKIEAYQKEIDKLQGAVNSIRDELNILQSQMQQLVNKQTEIETDGKHLRLQLDQKQKKLNELVGDCNIEDEIRIVEVKIGELTSNERILSESIKALEDAYGTMAMEKNTLISRKGIIEKGIETDRSRLNSLMKDKGFNTFDEVENSVLTKEKQELFKSDISDYEQQESNIQAQREITEKKLEGRSITAENWEAISSEYKQKTDEKEESISRYEVAKNIYRTTKTRNEQWKLLSERFDVISRKAGLLDQIKSMLKGNAFIEYVAEERLRYVARAASETLGEMTKYRYSLEIDPDYGFVICDNANGGVRRMVTSLSGGETFMTSLSLALALSKQIQLKGQSPLEFFFLDEGFGTLDANLLDTVIDSLEKLSSSERVIGLISHVPDLKNRIMRRLVIEPPSQDGRGSCVRIERG